MNHKKILEMAQLENQDGGRLSELKNISSVHYIMLLSAWVFVFTIRLIHKQATTDLLFMVYVLALGHEVYAFKRKKSIISLGVSAILVVAVLTTGWTLMSVIFK